MLAQMKGRGENMVITRRRETENKRAEMEAAVQYNHSVGQMAQWETKTAQVIEKNTILNLANQLKKRDQKTLDARKQRLRDLLAKDDQQYRKELSTLTETTAQKAVRMVEHARALKHQREERRQALAQQMYNKQWREGCDDLRLIDSNKFQNHCLKEVHNQLVEKEWSKERSRQEDQRWSRLMEENRLAELEKAQLETRKRQVFNYETKISLMQQMEETAKRRENEAMELERERQEFQRATLECAEEERMDAIEALAAKRAQLERIRKFNSETMRVKAEVTQMQKDQEMRELQMALDAHQHEQEMRSADKQAMRQDMLDYQDYLSRRKAEEAQMERELEHLCQEEMDRANAKRDMQWMREKLAREKLMADVLTTRMDQVKNREQQRMRREEEVALERAAIEREQEKAARLEEEEKAAARQKELERQQILDKQTAAHRNRLKIEKQASMKEYLAAEQAERQYQAFLEREKQELKKGLYVPKSYGLKTALW